MESRRFTFYHADRDGTLSPNTTITPSNGLSVFGQNYMSQINNGDLQIINNPEVQRELLIESVRASLFPTRPSRFSCLFAANTIDDACMFAVNITPKPCTPIRIFEVFSKNFTILDMNWLDYDNNDMATLIEYTKQYWYSSITQHSPSTGNRIPPSLEVLLPLPVEIGDVVKIANID